MQYVWYFVTSNQFKKYIWDEYHLFTLKRKFDLVALAAIKLENKLHRYYYSNQSVFKCYWIQLEANLFSRVHVKWIKSLVLVSNFRISELGQLSNHFLLFHFLTYSVPQHRKTFFKGRIFLFRFTRRQNFVLIKTKKNTKSCLLMNWIEHGLNDKKVNSTTCGHFIYTWTGGRTAIILLFNNFIIYWWWYCKTMTD